MSDLLIRNVPDEALETLRNVAAREHISLQTLALRLIADDAVRLRRKEALSSIKKRLVEDAARPLPEDATIEALAQIRRERGFELGASEAAE